MTYEELLELTNAGIEIWQPIAGYEGYYEISNLGNVRSLDRDVERGEHCLHIKGKAKKPNLGSHGYYYVMLCKNAKQKLTTLHRLLAETFIPNPNNLPEIDHINTDRTDYRLINLHWVTHKENANNAITLQNRKSIYTPEMIKRGLETRKRLKSANGAKTVYQYTKDGAFVAEYYSMEEARRETGIGHIHEVLDDSTKSAGGYLWSSVPMENLQYQRRLRSSSKTVQEFDKHGNLIGEWPSLSEAARQRNININIISRNIQTAHPKKYWFKYKEDTI